MKVVPVSNNENTPVLCDSITSVSIGSIYMRNRSDEALDSYQEADLERYKCTCICSLVDSILYMYMRIQCMWIGTCTTVE